jgi:ABC-type antimicrobial peptide transport system permease subunit
MLEDLDVDISAEDITPLINSLYSDYATWCLSQNPPLNPADNANFNTYLALPTVQASLTASITKLVGDSGIEKQVQTAFQTQMQKVMQTYMTAIMKELQKQITASMTTALADVGKNLSKAMNIDPNAFAKAFKVNLKQEDLQQIMASFLGGQDNTYKNNLSKLGFANRSDPSSISIYPKDFESKQRVLDILDGYNNTMKAAGDEEKVITYTDLVGTLMSSVTEIVDMISMVLIAFVAISLVVSSIMIGIITYISVLERKKEIGILRSIGARKRDIGNVFNAETLIVGFIAGCLGVGLTALLCIPANAIVEAQMDIANIAILPLIPGLALIVISCLLTFLAGLIPAGSASRKDPVEALRSE